MIRQYAVAHNGMVPVAVPDAISAVTAIVPSLRLPPDNDADFFWVPKLNYIKPVKL